MSEIKTFKPGENLRPGEQRSFDPAIDADSIIFGEGVIDTRRGTRSFNVGTFESNGGDVLKFTGYKIIKNVNKIKKGKVKCMFFVPKEQ